jgi:hypothetical protein
MENLVSSLESDHYLTQGIREWIRRLEITLNKLAARDPEFLQHEPDRPHSAVLMLNQLARLGNAQDVRDGIDREVGRRVDELLQRVVKEYDRNPGVFAEVVDELNPLVDRQVRAYRGNVERTVRASEGQQKLARARRAVLREMHKRLAGRRCPSWCCACSTRAGATCWCTPTCGAVRIPTSGAISWPASISSPVSSPATSSPAARRIVEPDKLLKRVVEGPEQHFLRSQQAHAADHGAVRRAGGRHHGQAGPGQLRHRREGERGCRARTRGAAAGARPADRRRRRTVQQSWGKAVERARHIQVGEWLATSDPKGGR